LYGYILFFTSVGLVWLALNIFYYIRREVFNNKGFKLYYGVVLVYRKGRSVHAPGFYKKF